MFIGPKVIKKIVDSIDIVKLMGTYGISIRASSRNELLALCPFHEDRTPSLSVNIKKKVYNCFGCGARGNALTLIMKKEGIIYFPDVVKRAAEIAGIDIDKEEAKNKKRRKEQEYVPR